MRRGARHPRFHSIHETGSTGHLHLPPALPSSHAQFVCSFEGLGAVGGGEGGARRGGAEVETLQRIYTVGRSGGKRAAEELRRGGGAMDGKKQRGGAEAHRKRRTRSEGGGGGAECCGGGGEERCSAERYSVFEVRSLFPLCCSLSS